MFYGTIENDRCFENTKVYVVEGNQYDIISMQTSMLFYSQMSVLRGHCGLQRVSGI